jgi:tetratricopeptide (TPR) repeat protein
LRQHLFDLAKMSGGGDGASEPGPAHPASRLEAEPGHFEALFRSALTAAQSGHLRRAVELFDEALGLRPDHAPAHCNRGVALAELDDFAGALSSYDRAISVQPDYAAAYSNRGNVQKKLGRLQAALSSFDRAVAIKPDLAEAYVNRGAVLEELGQFGAALRSYDRAIALRPDLPAEAYLNRGVLLAQLNRLELAVASYDRAIAIKPDFAAAYVNRSMASLLAGDFAAGWIDYEWRWRDETGTNAKERREFSRPLWSGQQSLAGKSILIYSEQGLGDTLQFCRYVKPLAELGARVILEVQKPLATLLSGLAGVSHLVARGGILPPFDYQCPLLSLPLAFKTRLESIPAATRYVHVDPTQAAQWRGKLPAAPGPRIGLMWSGNAMHRRDRYRSVALAELIRYLPAELQYVSLQKEVRESDLPALRSNADMLNFADAQKDFSDAAALCECMDLVISVDTSIAHLSGALGKETWILLPFSPDWRWLLDRVDSPWYPTVKLYRQERSGDWSEVLARVSADLRRRFAISEITQAAGTAGAR